jgi:threonyl-tRNA synthetase
MIKIKFPDGTIKEFDKGISILDIAKSISEGLAKIAIAGKVNGKLVDLSYKIEFDSNIEIITPKSKESLEILRHTTAHVFAQALLRLHNKALITIGPATENGFYYDIDFYKDLTDEDLKEIENEMKKIIKEDLTIEINYKTKNDALNFFKDNPYKQEIINSISSNNLTQEEKTQIDVEGDKFKFYKQGEFEDLCKGPHLPRTGLIKAFKLEKITKAYWRGDSNNKQLYRIYGTAFWKKSDMDKYYEMLEEAKKRDHRILGKKLDLFMFHEYSPGSAFFLPKGFVIYKKLQEFIREQYLKYNYKEVMTPNMFSKKLWEISGHWEHYKDDMFILNIDNQEFSLKPMNCPSHCLIFKNDFKSYKELPLRIADFGALHRNELSGALSGLTRVRKFCQDDAHIFCSINDVQKEIKNLLELIDYVYSKVFNMTYDIELSTRPDGSIGSDEIWELAETSLANALKENGKKYEICEGDGAFYGPKIDFRIKDCLGRIHQTATIQLDFNLPERFDLKYESENDGLQRPVMIHRAILGSVERFMAILIENFAGKFPLWLSPNQIKIINVADRHIDYCNKIAEKLKEKDFIVSTDYSNEGVGKKIALAREKEMPNYMIIIGDKDIENNTISVRTRKFEKGKNEEFTTSLNEFLERIEKERDNREIYY